MFDYNFDNIHIVEVGPRDGLQNEKQVINTEDKIEYIKLLKNAGLKTIEATSFVSPRAIPQMADAQDVYSGVSELQGEIELPCLVPNMKGFEQALDLGVKSIALFSATSSLFTQKNINATVEESFNRMREVSEAAHKNGIKVRAYVSTAFGCPYAGDMKVDELVKVINLFQDLKPYEISIGDTIGVATPKQVDNYLKEILKNIDPSRLAMHFHDTRGMALANTVTSLEHGIRVFDSSSAGLGGCPYAKGASGNVATEDMMYLFRSLGLKTGIDESKLLSASDFILKKLGKTQQSKYAQANQGLG